MGQIFEVVNSTDEVEKVNVIFTFCYKGGKYIVYKKKGESEETLYGDRVSYNLWRGFRFEYDWDDETKEIAKLIAERAEKNSLIGWAVEHYNVRRCEGDEYRIRRSARKLTFSPRGSVYSDALRFSVIIFLSMIYCALRFKFDTITYMYALFPDAQRKTLAIGFWIFCFVAAVCFFFLLKKSRDWWVVLYNILLPTECIVATAGIATNSIVRTVIAVVILGVALYGVIYKIYTKTKTEKIRKMMGRNLRTFLSSAVVVCFLSCAVMTRLFGVTSAVYTSDTRAENYEQLMSDYSVARQNIHPDVWETLDVNEKINALQTICDYECIVELGCDAPQVYIARWDDEMLLGEYSHITGELYISQDRFENDEVYEVVSTLLHEVRHAWQHSVIEVFNQIEGELDERQLALNFFRDAEEFRYNFENYYNGEDFEAYATQGVERDSREWSQRRLEEKYYFCLETE